MSFGPEGCSPRAARGGNQSSRLAQPAVHKSDSSTGLSRYHGALKITASPPYVTRRQSHSVSKFRALSKGQSGGDVVGGAS